MSKLDFIVVTGTRRWSGELHSAVLALREELDRDGFEGLVIHGKCATGTDRIADEIWGPACWPVPAPWTAFKRTLGEEAARLAGPARNAATAGAAGFLLGKGKKGKGFAFPDERSVGTYDCIGRLAQVGLPMDVRKIGDQ